MQYTCIWNISVRTLLSVVHSWDIAPNHCGDKENGGGIVFSL